MRSKDASPAIFLVAVLGAVLAVCRIVRTAIPFAVLPPLDIPNMVLLCGVAVLVCHLWNGVAATVNRATPLLGALVLGLLPLAAGFAAWVEAAVLAAVGAVAFPVVVWLYASMTQRLAGAPATKAALAAGVLGLYLAAQCFMGMPV